MEEYYFKADDRTAWQKNRILAYIVLIILYISDLLQGIPSYLSRFTGNLRKSRRHMVRPRKSWDMQTIQ